MTILCLSTIKWEPEEIFLSPYRHQSRTINRLGSGDGEKEPMIHSCLSHGKRASEKVFLPPRCAVVCSCSCSCSHSFSVAHAVVINNDKLVSRAPSGSFRKTRLSFFCKRTKGFLQRGPHRHHIQCFEVVVSVSQHGYRGGRTA